MKINIHNIMLGIIGLIVLAVTGCSSNPQQPEQFVAVPIPTVVEDGQLITLANRAADMYGLDNQLFQALVTHESGWDPSAISPKGARGLAQIMPSTGMAECGLEREVLLDAELNLHCGAFYLSKLLQRFNDVELALAAYNSGEGRVARLGHVPHIRETQRYVKRIMADWRGFNYD
ncbi:MAG: hypothetical protein BWK79_00915 [Beggiatoa sp. IS2]|nr:MAG: hypothetical protein BWK79_00915 [Beggiatoa sp. IS2]